MKQKTFRMAPKCVPPGFMVGRAPRAEGVTPHDPCELRDPLSPGPPLLSSPVEPRDRTAGVLALLPGKPHRRREIKNSYGEADIGLFCLSGWERSCADPGPPLLRSPGPGRVRPWSIPTSWEPQPRPYQQRALSQAGTRGQKEPLQRGR